MIRHARTSQLAAFTLVEILIIVVLLGIIAMVAVPQFTTASEDAKEASLLSTIKVLRKQIALYKAEHGGRGPHEGIAAIGDEPTDRLTKRTDAAGNVDPDGPYGPYISSWPANPFAKESVAKAITIGNIAKPPRNGMTGWYYDVNTCIISANSLTGGESSDPP